MSYFLKAYNCNRNKINVDLHLSNYDTRSDLIHTTEVFDRPEFAENDNLFQINKFDID